MADEPTGQDAPGGEDEPRRDPWDDVVLDESFVRGAAVTEPTARTRMLRERWKDGGPAPQPWRSDTPPAGWVHGSGDRQQRSGRGDKPPRRRRWFRRRGSDDGER